MQPRRWSEPSSRRKRPTVPVSLLVWGPGRILPVRVTDYSIDESTFLPSLHPLTAKISLVAGGSDARCVPMRVGSGD